MVVVLLITILTNIIHFVQEKFQKKKQKTKRQSTQVTACGWAVLSISVGPYISVVTITMQHHLYAHLSLDLVAPHIPTIHRLPHAALLFYLQQKSRANLCVVGSYTGFWYLFYLGPLL